MEKYVSFQGRIQDFFLTTATTKKIKNWRNNHLRP